MIRKTFTVLFICWMIPLFADAPRLLVMIEKGFNGDEFFGPTAAFEAAGYELVITSSREGRVPLRMDASENPPWDVPVDIAIADVNPDDFIGLFVPGGYSPGFLENDPDAVRVTRAFLEAGKPLGMVCHGPRVLLYNDLMGDRTWTGLFTLPDELADIWVQRPGRYLDQAVVRDGNLVTARYPRDMNVFSWAFLELLAEAPGGLPLQPRSGNVALLLSNSPEGWGNWHFFSRLMSAVEAFGITIQRAGGNNAEWMERVVDEVFAEDGGPSILAVDLSEEDWTNLPDSLRSKILTAPRLVAGEGMKDWLSDRELPTTWQEIRYIRPWTRAILSLADPTGENVNRFDPAFPPPPVLPDLAAADEPSVFLAVREGFDDDSLVAWVRALQDAGHSDLDFVSHETGIVKGRNGLEVEATLTHADVDGSKGQLVIAPGFFWPQLNPGARQTEQPDWLREQEARDAARADWLLKTRENGATLFLTGLDALRIGRMEAFAGKSFSSSDQTVWSFGRGRARHTNAPATLSAERLITVRAAENVPAALELLETSSDSITE
jgi:protease I